jgi:nitrate reductase delta subunit
VSRTLTGRRGAAASFTDRQLTVAWHAASLLLGYPDEELLGRLALVREASRALPERVGMPLRDCVSRLEGTLLPELEADYVETFDTRRRNSLFLTYFAHGDTRKRGLALVQFKQAFRKAGVEFDAAELPDHLSVVLEFGAAYDADTAWKLLNDHRAGIEMLRIALAERGSAWHDLLLALVATLPELRGEDEEKMVALIAQGPPSEEVGLDLQPYAMDPRLNPRPTDSVDLGPTIPVGAP